MGKLAKFCFCILLFYSVTDLKAQQITDRLNGKWKSMEVILNYKFELIFSKIEKSFIQITTDSLGNVLSKSRTSFSIVNDSILELKHKFKKEYCKVIIESNNTIKFYPYPSLIKESIQLFYLFTYRKFDTQSTP